MNGLPNDAPATVGQCLLLRAKRTGLGHRASVANDPARSGPYRHRNQTAVERAASGGLFLLAGLSLSLREWTAPSACVCFCCMGKSKGPRVRKPQDKIVTKKSAHNLAQNILALREMNPVGASAAQVRATVVWLRDCAENFEKAWTAVALPGTPQIKAIVHTFPMLPGSSIVYFGAEEPPSQGPLGPTIVNEHGDEIADQVAVSFFMFGNNVPDLTMGPNPFEERVVSIPEFFAGTVYIRDGVTVSRNDVINFAAYELGVVHSHEGKYQRENLDKIAVLTALHESAPLHLRDNVDYLLLSIARDFARPGGDIDKLLRTTGALP
jgi:hypothetical protein